MASQVMHLRDRSSFSKEKSLLLPRQTHQATLTHCLQSVHPTSLVLIKAHQAALEDLAPSVCRLEGSKCTKHVDLECLIQWQSFDSVAVILLTVNK